jgi:uncharacterized protein (UPF0332 family)
VSEIEALLEKAERSFAAAEQMLGWGDADFAASRAYYGYFYIAEALLLSKDMNFSRHGQVIAGYGRHFAKTEVLDPRFHRLMRRAFALRQTADYSTEPPPDADTVRELIEGGEDFLRDARAYLAR